MTALRQVSRHVDIGFRLYHPGFRTCFLSLGEDTIGIARPSHSPLHCSRIPHRQLSALPSCHPATSPVQSKALLLVGSLPFNVRVLNIDRPAGKVWDCSGWAALGRRVDRVRVQLFNSCYLFPDPHRPPPCAMATSEPRAVDNASPDVRYHPASTATLNTDIRTLIALKDIVESPLVKAVFESVIVILSLVRVRVSLRSHSCVHLSVTRPGRGKGGPLRGTGQGLCPSVPRVEECDRRDGRGQLEWSQ